MEDQDLADRWVMPESAFARLIEMLVDEFDQVLGSVVDSGVVRLRSIRTLSDLPTGVIDQQEAATYRLVDTDTSHQFSFGVGPDSLKATVHPPAVPVWTMRRRDGSVIVDPARRPAASR